MFVSGMPGSSHRASPCITPCDVSPAAVQDGSRCIGCRPAPTCQPVRRPARFLARPDPLTRRRQPPRFPLTTPLVKGKPPVRGRRRFSFRSSKSSDRRRWSERCPRARRATAATWCTRHRDQLHRAGEMAFVQRIRRRESALHPDSHDAEHPASHASSALPRCAGGECPAECTASDAVHRVTRRPRHRMHRIGCRASSVGHRMPRTRCTARCEHRWPTRTRRCGASCIGCTTPRAGGQPHLGTRSRRRTRAPIRESRHRRSAGSQPRDLTPLTRHPRSRCGRARPP